MKRKVEIFGAGCAVCDELVERVRGMACPSCDIVVLNMKQPDVVKRAKELRVSSIPAVAINGTLADCCSGRGPDEEALRTAGLGQPLA